MLTQSRKSGPVPITVLSDWWLIVCVPLLVLNVLMYLARRTVLAAYFAALRLVGTRILLVMSSFSLVNIPLIIAINVLLTITLLLLQLPLEHPLSLFLIAACFVSSMMFLQTNRLANDYENGNRTDLILKLTVLHNREWNIDSKPIPDGLEIDRMSHGTWLSAIMLTVFILAHFTLLVIASDSSVVFWVSMHALFLVFFLSEFELTEHLAAHSRNGILVKLNGGTPLAKLFYALEQIRIYVVWPMYSWAPKRYFITHTHHHHIVPIGNQHCGLI